MYNTFFLSTVITILIILCIRMGANTMELLPLYGFLISTLFAHLLIYYNSVEYMIRVIHTIIIILTIMLNFVMKRKDFIK